MLQVLCPYLISYTVFGNRRSRRNPCKSLSVLGRKNAAPLLAVEETVIHRLYGLSVAAEIQFNDISGVSVRCRILYMKPVQELVLLLFSRSYRLFVQRRNAFQQCGRPVPIPQGHIDLSASCCLVCDAEHFIDLGPPAVKQAADGIPAYVSECCSLAAVDYFTGFFDFGEIALHDFPLVSGLHSGEARDFGYLVRQP